MFHNLGDPSKSISSVKFTSYSCDEVRRLSVKQVTNPRSLDILLNPTDGGLYDAAFGAADRDDLCSTCMLGSVQCSGHVGHIDLPVPIYHPLHFKIIHSLLRGSCFKCKKLLIPRDKVILFARQLEAVENGLISSVDALQEAKNELMERVVTASSDVGSMQEIQDCLNEAYLKQVEKHEANQENIAKRSSLGWSRNATDVHLELVGRFMKLLTKGIRKCPHCGAYVQTVRAEHNSKFYLNEGKSDDDRVTEAMQVYLTPDVVKAQITDLWNNEKDVLSYIFSSMVDTDSFSHNNNSTVEEVGSKCSAMDVFFLQTLLVPPSRFRPLGSVNGMQFENPQTTAYTKVITDCRKIHMILKKLSDKEQKVVEEEEDDDGEDNEIFKKVMKEMDQNIKLKNKKVDILSDVPGDSLAEKFQNVWHSLQQHVNVVIDSDLDRLNKQDSGRAYGIKQILEKKDGLFRKNMMGKRVNYAARSVISPDPYIATNEIGVPLVFATRLTYPAPVTPWNLQQLRQAVINGPKVHPGATHVISDGRTTILSADDQVQREAIAKKLVAASDECTGEEDAALYQPKTVLRHIQSGDVMLVNRQPTLHKGSIMAHKVRVLPGEKTLRLHYANCKSYNADFDGDEMNAHFPQNELCRAEAYGIMLTDRQYLSGKDGKPLSGLMQDHMVAGVTMSLRGRFYNKDEYTHLLYNSLMGHKKRIKLLPPTILKPQVLWSGKQIFSTILLNLIPDDKPYLNLTGKSKIGGKNWQRGPSRSSATGRNVKPNEMCESQVVIRNGELLCGVLDKAHYGASEYGLIHAIFELYGGDVSGKLLTSLARLFTAFLQFFRGFTLGVEDILVTSSANEARQKTIENSRTKGVDTIAEALNVGKANRDDVTVVKDAYENAHLTQLNPTKVSDDKIAVVDHSMKKVGNNVNDDIVKSCMGDGLLKTFPENNLQLMVISGAKGGAVNCYQISCLLGQIELEGKRPPLMLSGRSCPSFKPYDTTLRAGGFVSQRFLTGVRPQEYFFHCMAGREGLIDTAVKTSRSGYLQRCLIKHLEGLLMSYDMTVRDSDGSVIQFMYGEDGIDVTKSSCLKEKQTNFIVDNHLAIAQGLGGMEKIDEMEESSKLKSKWRKYDRAKARMERKGWTLKQPRSGNFLDFSKKSDISDKKKLMEKYRKLSEEERASYNSKDSKIRMADTIISQYRADHYFGSISDQFKDRLTKLRKTNRNLDVDDPATNQLTLDRLETLMKFKYQRSLCEPGESVGLVAAQSVGEPSTQMTLNTFHFAGRGDMNVTLGIPRLREILMVASRQIKTPQITVPIRCGAREDGEELCRSLTKVRLSKIMNQFTLEEQLVVDGSERYRKAAVEFQLVSSKTIHEIGLTKQRIIKHMEKRFFPNLVTSLSKQLKKLREEKEMIDQRVAKDISRRNKNNDDDEQEFQVEKDGENEADSDEEEDEESAKKEHHKDDEDEVEEGSDVDDEDDDDDDDKEEGNNTDDDEQQGGSKEEIELGSSNRDIRIAAVMSLFHEGTRVLDYQFDSKHKSCQLVLRMPMTLDINTASVIRQEIERSCVRQVRGITRAIMVDAQPGMGGDADDKPMNLVTEGINFTKMFENQHIVDVNKLYSNCVHSMASVYGIEAARRVIVKEITNVFAVYGIEVDPRHLGLIADYMCNEGSYKAFNRQSMISCSSPLQQMSFETTMKFLNSAALHSSEDTLQSPSARIVTGQVVKGGTGHFDLIYPIGGSK